VYYPLTVRDFLDRAAHVYPDRVAVVDEPEQPGPSLGELTYGELAALARAQAARLDQLDVPVGGRVAVVSQNSARLLTSFFGVAGWGRVLVPVNFRLTRPEIDYIVRHSGASVVYADASCAELLDTLDVKHKFVLGDDDVISGGENVSSIEVEDVITSHPAVREVAVIGIPDAKWGELVTALVVTTDQSPLNAEELIAHCRTRLAGFKCPKRVDFVESLPRTATGKLQKFKLREPFWQG
jgi:acyl-CoA synthetase (AMP-forming)/AMP-acid ligase II